LRYYYPQFKNSKTRYLTFTVVSKVLRLYGHEIVNTEKEADAILFSGCDVLDIKDLRRLRKETSKPLIFGGAYSFNYWSAKLYSDAVWVGEIFEFAKLKSLAEIYDSKHSFTGDDEEGLTASTLIEWDKVPIAQVTKTHCYYWGGVGCKNKCNFCYTSWTHKHIENTRQNIRQAQEIAKRNKIHLMTVSNEYSYEDGNKTKDVLIKDFIKMPIKASLVRCGIEFATEDVRKKMSKPITREDISKLVQKISKDNIMVRLFHVTGYEPLEDWHRYIKELGDLLFKYPNKRMIHLMFNNLQYQNYTPLYGERFNINPDNYIDIKQTKAWFDELRQQTPHVLVGAPSPFQHVVCRMGIELATDQGQAEFFFNMLNHKKDYTKQQAYDALMESNVLHTERRKLNLKNGKITKVNTL